MSAHPCFGAERITSNAIKGQSSQGSGKQGTSIRHLVGRLVLLHKVLTKNTAQSSGVNYQACLEYAVQGFKHSNAEVRNQAQLCIVEIYRVIGSSRMKQVLQHSGLRQAQTELLQEGFNVIEGGVVT